MPQVNLFVTIKIWDRWIRPAYLSLGKDKNFALCDIAGIMWLIEEEIMEDNPV